MKHPLSVERWMSRKRHARRESDAFRVRTSCRIGSVQVRSDFRIRVTDHVSKCMKPTDNQT